MRTKCVLYRRAEAEMRGDENQRRPCRLSTGAGKRGIDFGQVVTVGHVDRLPAAGVEAFANVFGEGNVGAGGERDAVAVVEANQLAEPEVAGKRGCFSGDALHQITIADDHKAAVVDRGMALAVVTRRQMRLGDRHANGVGETLAERPCGDFDTGRVLALRVAGRLAAPLAEALDIG